MDMGILTTWSRQDRVKCALTVDVYAPHSTVRVAAELLSLVSLAFYRCLCAVQNRAPVHQCSTNIARCDTFVPHATAQHRTRQRTTTRCGSNTGLATLMQWARYLGGFASPGDALCGAWSPVGVRALSVRCVGQRRPTSYQLYRIVRSTLPATGRFCRE
jgi:hypothetical protein